MKKKWEEKVNFRKNSKVMIWDAIQRIDFLYVFIF